MFPKRQHLSRDATQPVGPITQDSEEEFDDQVEKHSFTKQISVHYILHFDVGKCKITHKQVSVDSPTRSEQLP